MKRMVVALLCLVAVPVRAQVPEILELSWCQREAAGQYPLTRQRELMDRITAEKISSLSKVSLPQVYLNGQAGYQSEVTTIPIDVPFIEIPAMDKENYRLSLDVSQVIYDGGVTRSQKELEKAGLKADRQQLEVELYRIRERVDQLFFTLLLLQENRKVLESTLDALRQRESRLEAGVRNGVVLESQLFVLQAEILRLEQQLGELNISRQSGLEMLGELINHPLTSGQAFQVPELPDPGQGDIYQRPESLAFRYQQDRIEADRAVRAGKYRPKINAFAQAGYGKPGLNMLKDEADDWWLVGAKFSWNLWNWNQLNREHKILGLQQEMISAQQETFDKNLKITLEDQLAQIAKAKYLLEKDAEIVRLRTEVTRAAAAQLENGVITSSDYISELNQETLARLSQESHRIQLVRARAGYLTAAGK